MFQAAATLFSAKGFDGVSVDDIAALAGVNKAMIYYHFADKIALYRSVVADMLMAVSEKVAAIAESADHAHQKNSIGSSRTSCAWPTNGRGSRL